MKRIAFSLVVALFGAACGRGPVSSSGLELLPLEGKVEVLHGGHWNVVSERTVLSRGDQVRSGADGKARIHLPGQQTVELAPDALVLVTGEEDAEVLGGSVLAQARGGLMVAIDGLEVTAADAVFRLDLGLSRRLAVYRGEAEVPSSGWDDPVTAFQQLTLVGRSAPRGPVPLEVDTHDRWDVRLLGEAMDVGLALLQQETGKLLLLGELDRLPRGPKPLGARGRTRQKPWGHILLSQLRPICRLLEAINAYLAEERAAKEAPAPREKSRSASTFLAANANALQPGTD